MSSSDHNCKAGISTTTKLQKSVENREQVCMLMIKMRVDDWTPPSCTHTYCLSWRNSQVRWRDDVRFQETLGIRLSSACVCVAIHFTSLLLKYFLITHTEIFFINRTHKMITESEITAVFTLQPPLTQNCPACSRSRRRRVNKNGAN